jgi:hypothetical protein
MGRNKSRHREVEKRDGERRWMESFVWKEKIFSTQAVFVSSKKLTLTKNTQVKIVAK